MQGSAGGLVSAVGTSLGWRGGGRLGDCCRYGLRLPHHTHILTNARLASCFNTKHMRKASVAASRRGINPSAHFPPPSTHSTSMIHALRLHARFERSSELPTHDCPRGVLTFILVLSPLALVIVSDLGNLFIGDVQLICAQRPQRLKQNLVPKNRVNMAEAPCCS